METLTKGEKAWRSLMNPSSKDIAASECLLLFTIKNNKNICTSNIQQQMALNWEEIHRENPNFYIIWSKGYDIENELIRFEDIGILKINNWENEEPCWILTEKGNEIFEEWKNELKIYCMSIQNNQGRKISL